MDDQLLKRIFDEDISSHERRFQLLKLKLMLSFGLFGVGSVKLGNSSINSYLFLVLPLVPILIDFANMAESYNLRRNLAFLKKQCGGKFDSFVEHIEQNRNPIYMRTNIALTAFIGGAAVLLFNISSTEKWYNFFYLSIAIPAAILYQHFDKRIRVQLKRKDKEVPSEFNEEKYTTNR